MINGVWPLSILFISTPFACPVSLHIHSSCALRQFHNDEDHIEQLWNGITSQISSMQQRKPHVTTGRRLEWESALARTIRKFTLACSIFVFFFPFPYSCPCLAVSLSQPLLAEQPVNDGPSSSSEPWVDACLCDSCGVLSKTKGAWQAAALRLDQTGLVYWSSPLCSVLLRSCVWLRVGGFCSSRRENGNHSDHTQGGLNHHKGKQKRLTHFEYDFFNHFMSVII